jgi:hypothetical protein
MATKVTVHARSAIQQRVRGTHHSATLVQNNTGSRSISTPKAANWLPGTAGFYPRVDGACG